LKSGKPEIDTSHTYAGVIESFKTEYNMMFLRLDDGTMTTVGGSAEFITRMMPLLGKRVEITTRTTVTIEPKPV
jgi:hypothetical protein